MSKRLVTIFSATSLGVGLLIGSKYEKRLSNRTANVNNPQINDTKYILPIGLAPVVSASASVSHISSVPALPDKNITPAAPGRVAQIMKHGFPGLDNLRSFDDFVLSYDKRNRTAHWVFEHLTADKVMFNEEVKREDFSFQADEGVHKYFQGTNEDYKKSGYDRGHLAAAANHRWDKQAMQQTFTLSNIAPQVGNGFNRDAWNTLEKFVRGLTKKYDNVYVCTGPLYLPKKENDGKMYVKYEVIGQNHVAVPTHFFKVVVCESNQGYHDLLAFVMPNQAIQGEVNLKNYLVPVETIERASGLLMFDKIPRKSFRSINNKKV